MTSKKQLIDDLHRVRVNAKHHFDIQTALRAIKFLEGLPDEPAASNQPCVHPWCWIVFSEDGNPACTACKTNLLGPSLLPAGHKHGCAVSSYLRGVERVACDCGGASNEPLAALDARLDGVKREMATNLYSRAAAVLRAYAQDAGDDHSVGICNCSDIALVDELDTAARASQPPGDVPGLLHTLEVLRQRWSHNVNFEATIGACITEIELCAAGSTSSAVTGPARTVVE